MKDEKNFFDHWLAVEATDTAMVEHPKVAPKAAGLVDAGGEDSSEIEAVVQESDALPIEMAAEAKRALVNLLRFGVILATNKMHLFQTICRYEVPLRAHLSNMYLKLVLDEKAGVAFVANMNDAEVETAAEDGDSTDEGVVSLIARRTLSLYDTFLLLVLRKYYQERETSGEQKVVIDIERIEANLSPFLPLTNSTSSERSRLNSALNKMVERRVLSSIRGSDERFEITPIIRYVVNAQFLETLYENYLTLARGETITEEKPVMTAEASVMTPRHKPAHSKAHKLPKTTTIEGGTNTLGVQEDLLTLSLAQDNKGALDE